MFLLSLIKVIVGAWLLAHNVADRIINQTIEEAKEKPSTERNVIEEFLIFACKSEAELYVLPEKLGLATNKDVERLEEKLNNFLSEKRVKGQ